VTAASTATRARNADATASATVAAAASGNVVPLGGTIIGGALAGLGHLSADAEVIPAVKGSADHLLDILRGEAYQRATTPERACPYDGEPYHRNTTGDLYCPFDGFLPDEMEVWA
jgi:hypothetical protein